MQFYFLVDLFVVDHQSFCSAPWFSYQEAWTAMLRLVRVFVFVNQTGLHAFFDLASNLSHVIF